MAFTLHVGRVGTQVHHLRDGFAAAVFGIVFEEFAQLEEEHDEDSFGHLVLGTGQKADEQRADGGDTHEEILVERVALGDSFPGFGQHVVADQHVGHEIDEQQLPHL